MKNSLLMLLIVSTVLFLTSCALTQNVSDTFSGQGTGEITDLGNGQFDILAVGGFSGNRANTYAKWDRTAKLACNGGAYKIIEREWQSAEYPGLLGGIIECNGGVASSKAAPNSHQVSKPKREHSDTNIITCVQKKLSDLGYSPGSADGIMGGKTSKAIKAYQKDNGFPITGEIDDSTISNLGCH